MGLLDFFASNAANGSAPLLGQQPSVSGLLAPPQPAANPAQQKWMDALGVISAGLRDAGAYLQHQPQAAGNVAAFVRQRGGLQTPGAISPTLAGLPPMITAALLLNAAHQTRAPQPPNGNAPQPAALPTGPLSATDPNSPASPPEGIDPLIWQRMTPEQRAQWQK
jgi:hypothetical protein